MDVVIRVFYGHANAAIYLLGRVNPSLEPPFQYLTLDGQLLSESLAGWELRLALSSGSPLRPHIRLTHMILHKLALLNAPRINLITIASREALLLYHSSEDRTTYVAQMETICMQ